MRVGGQVWRVAVSPDSTLIASASWDYTVRLWQVDSGACLHTFTGHTNYVRGPRHSSSVPTLTAFGLACWPCGQVLGVAFARGGAYLLTASKDRTVRLWDVAARQEVETQHFDVSLMSLVVLRDEWDDMVYASALHLAVGERARAADTSRWGTFSSCLHALPFYLRIHACVVAANAPVLPLREHFDIAKRLLNSSP